MAEPTSSGAFATLGIKSGLLAGAFVMIASALAVVLGFTVVPLAPGRELQDAGRRLAAGVLCSFTIGPLLAFKAIEWWPSLMTPWEHILTGQHILWRYLASATPFIALSGVLGFWIVAALMRWFQKREGKDIGELVADARQDFKGG